MEKILFCIFICVSSRCVMITAFFWWGIVELYMWTKCFWSLGPINPICHPALLKGDRHHVLFCFEMGLMVTVALIKQWKDSISVVQTHDCGQVP